jgi:hypothetical protein
MAADGEVRVAVAPASPRRTGTAASAEEAAGADAPHAAPPASAAADAVAATVDAAAPAPSSRLARLRARLPPVAQLRGGAQMATGLCAACLLALCPRSAQAFQGRGVWTGAHAHACVRGSRSIPTRAV